MYEKPALDSIILKYREYDIGINFVDKRVHFNVDNNIESIYDYNVTNDYQFLEYSFDFNGDILQTIFESYKPVLLFYPVQGPTNTDYVFNGNNYTQFISTWEASWIPAGPSFTIVDTVSYEFTTLLNNGKIPLQFPLRNYTWNQFNFKIFPFGSNILYMLNAKGIGKKVNKNLIHSITIRGSENLTLIYDYVFNSNNQIIEMKISNSETGAITNSFKMTYYE
jgi:hypothetical protein